MKHRVLWIMIVCVSILAVGCRGTQVREDAKVKEEAKPATTDAEATAKPPEKVEQPVAPREPVTTTPVVKEPAVAAVTKTQPWQDLTICLCWQTQCQFAGFYVALDKGFYREEGLNVTLKPGGPDVRPFQEVTDGRAQFGTGQAQEVLTARDKGTPIQCVATNFQTGALRLVAKKNLGITGPLDLKGKKISLWFGGYEHQCLGLLEKYGISQDEVTLEKQGWTMDDFCEGKVDVASVMVYNELNTLYERGVNDIDVINYADYDVNFPEDTIFALEEYIQKNPEVVSKVLKASYRGWRWAMDNPKDAVAIVMKYNDKLNPEHESNMLREVTKLMNTPRTQEHGLGYIYRPDWLVMAKVLFQQKLLKDIPDIERAANSSFIEQVKIFPPK